MSQRTGTARFAASRFEVVYRLAAGGADAEDRARNIALEQTVELPDDVVKDVGIREHIVGRLVALEQKAAGESLATISYSSATAGDELSQLLNVIFGNTSMQPGVRVEAVRLPDDLAARFPGPRFGRAGLRERLGVADRPLLCTALKPMGLDASALAEMAYRFALGGIDVIKDDHGLADQAFAGFEERVTRCVEAVERANDETGRRSVYAPNVSAAGTKTLERARYARRAGAGAALVMPGLVGFGTLQELARDPDTDLPLLMHPSFLGAFVASASAGIAHGVLFGTFARLGGADAVIFPSYGGRFSFTRNECLSIADACGAELGALRPSMPVPAGGMVLARVPELLETYGSEVMLLVGGDLYRASPDLAANAFAFRELLGERGAPIP